MPAPICIGDDTIRRRMNRRSVSILEVADIMTDGALSRSLYHATNPPTRKPPIDAPCVPKASRAAIRAARMKGKEEKG